jgi:hypothetical protein
MINISINSKNIIIKKRTKKIIVIFSLFLILSLFTIYLYNKKFKPYLNNSRFEMALKDSAKISDRYLDEKYKDMKIKEKYKVVFVTNTGGENNYAETFKYAAEKIGWEVRVYSEDINTVYKEVLNFDPDFIIYSFGAKHYLNSPLKEHRSRKYLNNHTLLIGLRGYNFLDKENPYRLTGNFTLEIFHAVFTIPQEVDFFRKIFTGIKKNFNGLGVMPFTPGIINKPAEPKQLMWGGAMGWDNFRSSEQYKKFIKLVSDNVPMKVSGPYAKLNYLPLGVYDGYTPSGMPQIEAIRKNGIYLLTHADIYIEAGVPTSRIFEALAANVVVISDKHPFAIEHFGDNFLYFDQNADSEAMYKQVKAHYDWIKANPEKAKAMAARAHQIFLEKFTVEKDLIRIAKMHEYVIQQEKEMGLSYPLAY